MQLPPPRSKADLLALTRSLPDSAFFLEHSRERELAYIERSFARWAEVIETAQRRLPATRPLACLDIGISPFTFLLKGHFGNVTALDLTPALKERCAASGIALEGGGVDTLGSLRLGSPLDCVFFLEVIEHLHTDPVVVLRNARALLRPGGLLVLSTPNLMCLANRVSMLRNRKLRHFTYPPFSLQDAAHGFGHDRIYMPEELHDYFLAAGFQAAEIRYQLNVDDTAHRSESWPRRVLAGAPRLVKQLVPSVRDGILVLGRNAAAH